MYVSYLPAAKPLIHKFLTKLIKRFEFRALKVQILPASSFPTPYIIIMVITAKCQGPPRSE